MARVYRIGQTNSWAATVPLIVDDDKERAKINSTPLALHFVIDNSGSMGSMTRTVKEMFAQLVDSAASSACSVTLFSTVATLQSASITSSRQMLELPNVDQGMTNIPAGIRSAIEVIALAEKRKEADGELNVKKKNKIHHIVVLLTDGAHNSGPGPTTEFPKIGRERAAVIPNVQLSVVVVGVTRNSSTSMGMLLKTNLETVPLEGMENIYFCSTAREMRKVLGNLVDGLTQVSSGTTHCISHPCGNIVEEIDQPLAVTTSIRTTPNDSRIELLLESRDPPTYLLMDGVKMEMDVRENEVDCELVSRILVHHINKTRIRWVAGSSGSNCQSLQGAIKHLNGLIDALETTMVQGSGIELTLTKARGADRLAQNRIIIKAMHGAKELRNHLADIANFSANSSEEQAAFLTGYKNKYAGKATRRAAKRSGNSMILDPQKELNRVYKEVSSSQFKEKLISLLRADTISHLARLKPSQIKILVNHVKATRLSDIRILQKILKMVKASKIAEAKVIAKYQDAFASNNNCYDVLIESDSDTKTFVDSGSLANYLNDVFFGGRRSYLTLSSPWEHVAEWCNFNNNFESQWEMLLYAGSVGNSIQVERSSATQMNPFQLSIKKVSTTLIDTASLCFANHSQINVYGPEAGEPIKDALVLIDPSCPNASCKIVSSTLLGETFTSVVLSRDLHMYSGASMKIALLAHSLFRCLQPETNNSTTKAEILAEIRREFLGRAYQCGSCGFGPVDHGGCQNLLSHHGEEDDRGGVASNACPFCGWFSDDLHDWESWDGTVPETLISDRVNEQECSDSKSSKPLYSKMDLVLRILYSFRKMFCYNDNPIKETYMEFAKRLVNWDLRFTTTDEIDGLVQILIAAMAFSDDEIAVDSGGFETKYDVDSVFAPSVVLAIVNEACARAARKKFRMASGGDEIKAQKLAVQQVTTMLSVTESSAPHTTDSLLDPEPSRNVVEESCSQDYSINDNGEQAWVSKIANRWCTALAFAKALRQAIIKRGGGWKRLEQDMETSLDNYKDVVKNLQNASISGSHDGNDFGDDGENAFVLDACDIRKEDACRTYTTMAAQAFLYNKGSSRQQLELLGDVRDADTLGKLARDMRMNIYSERVREKLAQWTDQGELLTFMNARAADIGQYLELAQAHGNHVHGLDRETFWGLWEAAIYDGHRGDKVMAFLETANEGFRSKHAPSGGDLTGRRRNKI